MIENYFRSSVYVFRMGIMNSEESKNPWCATDSLMTPEEGAFVRTGLHPLSRSEAVCLMAQGAQVVTWWSKMDSDKRQQLLDGFKSLV